MAYILYVSLLATSIYLPLVRSETPNDFGPFEVEIDGFTLCPGAKQLPGTEFHPSISTEKDKPQRVQLNYTFYKEFFLESGNFFFDMNIEDIMRSLVGSSSAYGRFTIMIYFQLTKGTPQVCLKIDSFKVKQKLKKVVQTK